MPPSLDSQHKLVLGYSGILPGYGPLCTNFNSTLGKHSWRPKGLWVILKFQDARFWGPQPKAQGSLCVLQYNGFEISS